MKGEQVKREGAPTDERRRLPLRPVLRLALAAGGVWALWPLLWLALNAGPLSRQEPGAASLFAAAPRVYFTGSEAKVGGPPDVPWGRYLLRRDEQLNTPLARFGWVHTDQFGAAHIYTQGEQRMEAVCRKFSRYFSVCVVAPPS